MVVVLMLPSPRLHLYEVADMSAIESVYELLAHVTLSVGPVEVSMMSLKDGVHCVYACTCAAIFTASPRLMMVSGSIFQSVFFCMSQSSSHFLAYP